METRTETSRAEDIRQIRRMRLASVLEATTLALLVFVAVPLKHIFGVPQATAFMGPVHGLAFLFYIWMLVQAVTASQWSRPVMLRMTLFAFIPLAGFANERMLWRQEQKLSSQPQ